MTQPDAPRITPKVLSRLLERSLPASSPNRLRSLARPYVCPYHLILEWVRPGSRVFDLGCGNGLFLFMVSRFRQPTALGGLETSDRWIEEAEDLLDAVGVPVDLKIYDGEAIPPGIAEFDTVTMIDVLHHVKENQHWIERLYRAMKPGARLILKDIDRSSPLVVFNRLHDAILWNTGGHERSANEAVATLEGLGYEMEKVVLTRMLWYPHYMIIATKK